MDWVQNGIKTLPKISTSCVGCTNVTDDRRTDDRRICDSKYAKVTYSHVRVKNIIYCMWDQIYE